MHRELIKQNKGVNEALVSAKIGMKHKSWAIQESSLKLFQQLVIKKQALKEAIEAAKEGLKNEDPRLQKESLDLWKLLVAYPEGIKEAKSLLKQIPTAVAEKLQEVINNSI